MADQETTELRWVGDGLQSAASRHIPYEVRLAGRNEGKGRSVSAECHTCGWDLPFEGECVVCGLRSKLDTAREALRYVTTAGTLQAAKTTAEAGLRLSSSPTQESETP